MTINLCHCGKPANENQETCSEHEVSDDKAFGALIAAGLFFLLVIGAFATFSSKPDSPDAPKPIEELFKKPPPGEGK